MKAGQFGSAGKIGLDEIKGEAKEPRAKKNHNNIKEVRNTKTLRYLNLDLSSPMMRESMDQLGMVEDDLDYRKSMDDFYPKKGEP